MSSLVVYFGGLLITMGIVYAALLNLRKPLFAVLDDLCRDSGRARFWAAFCNAILFLVPLALGLGAHPLAPSLPNALNDITNQFETAILGFCVSGFLLGWMLTRAIRLQPTNRDDER